MSNYLRLKNMLYIVSLSAIAIVVGFIEIPWPLVPWLKLDFSEVVILVSVLILGVKKTFIVILLRSAARFPITLGGFFGLPGALIGEGIAILASVVIVLAYILAKKLLKIDEHPLVYEVDIDNKSTVKHFFVITIVITTALTIVLFSVNFFITTPMFFSLLGFTESGAFHPTVFTFIPDATGFASREGGLAIDDVFYGNWGGYILFSIIAYVPFNIVKGILVSIVFLLIKPRMKYLEL